MPNLISHIRKYSRGIDRIHMDSRYEELLFLGQPGLDFFLLAAASAAIASFGFAMDSTSVIIGAMVISPLLYPIALMGSALSLTRWREAWALLQSLGAGVALSVVVSLVISWAIPGAAYGTEITTRLTSSPLLYVLVAFVSGVAGTFAYYWPDISESITGVGIAVALVPPLVMVGIGLGRSDLDLVVVSSTIVGLNIGGLVSAAILTSALMWRYVRKAS